MKSNGLVIAIDGPAASGKSTTAKLVAGRLGYVYIDTGAMYRAVTLAALRRGVDVERQDDVERLAATLHVHFERDSEGAMRIYLDQEDVSSDVRLPEVTQQVSTVSSFPGVRSSMVELQRKMSRLGGVVIDGRDIGTVVFPDADVKIFMVADIDARAHRRQHDLELSGRHFEVDTVAHDLEERDRKDSSRKHSPLRKAEDAIEIDTSNLTIDQQVDRVVDLARNVLEQFAATRSNHELE